MSNTIVRSILADQLNISADPNGTCSISIRGASELLGVPKSSLFNRLKALRSACPSAFSDSDAHEAVVQQDFQPFCATVPDHEKTDSKPYILPVHSISDFELESLLIWYAAEAPRGRTDEAKKLLSLVLSIGVRGWMQAEAGHDGTVQELVQSVKIDRLEIDAEVDRRLLERMSAMDKARAIQIAKVHSDAEERIQLHISESAKHTIEYQDVQLERLYRENLKLKATIQEKYSIVLSDLDWASLKAAPPKCEPKTRAALTKALRLIDELENCICRMPASLSRSPLLDILVSNGR